MEIPTVEDLANQLQVVSGADGVEPDAAIQLIADVDSLDLMEWLYNFQNQYPHIPADESLFRDIDETTTMRTIHGRILALVSQQSAV